MKYLAFIIIFNVELDAFSQNHEYLEGTKLILNLPDDFVLDRSLPGFQSQRDKSSIRVYEMDIPLTFEKWKEKQVERILLQGFDTLKPMTATFNGYDSFQLYAIDSITKEEKFLLMFGTNEFQVNAIATYTTKRKDEIVNIILKGNYDESIEINPIASLGFMANHQGSSLEISGLSAVSLKYEERDDTNEIISYLGLNRIEKSFFEGISIDEAVEGVALTYFPTGRELMEENHTIDNQPAKTKIYRTNHGTYDEFNVITIVYSDEFDIVAVGGVNQRMNIETIKKIIESIKMN